MTELKPDRITQKYLRRWPDSRLAKSWAGRMVHIETENGVWRTAGHGYTYAGTPEAWVLPFEEAQRQVKHCGPEKRAAFIAVPDRRPSPSISEGEVEALIAEAADFTERMTGQPWACELIERLASILAASKARATTEVEAGPLAPFRDLMSELGTSNTFQAGGNEDFQAGAKWMKAQMRARIRTALAGGE